MFLKLKIFTRKTTQGGKGDRPLYSYEVEGNNAIKRLIIQLLEEFFGMKIAGKVREKMNEITNENKSEKIDEIKNIIGDDN
jgi:hypothetical protein